MKALSYLLLLIAATCASKAEDFDFELLPTPNGENYPLGNIKAYNKNNLIMSQASPDLTDQFYMRTYYSKDKGKTWKRDKYATVCSLTYYHGNDDDFLICVPMINIYKGDPNSFFEQGVHYSFDNGTTWKSAAEVILSYQKKDDKFKIVEVKKNTFWWMDDDNGITENIITPYRFRWNYITHGPVKDIAFSNKDSIFFLLTEIRNMNM